jgi:ABC-type Fe2+-enterobactin transport system substrate-binding protein
VIAANTGGMIVSDGQNVKIVSTSGTVTAAYLTVNGGAAATGTYNS